jgi:hypothetical protein
MFGRWQTQRRLKVDGLRSEKVREMTETTYAESEELPTDGV